MTRLPLFPLGTVLVPTAVLPLHIFEPRYRALMADLTGGADGLPAFESEFGVVLISRGSEVGGGEIRVDTGTVAQVLEAQELPDGRWVVAAVGTRRFRIVRSLPDDPYPLAEVTDLGEPDAWGDGHAALLAETERRLRRALGLAAELGEAAAPMTFDLAEDPLVAAWQLVALAPIATFDRQRLLETDDAGDRLRELATMIEDVTSVLAYRLAAGQ